MVRNTIEEFEKNINESKNHLDLILYYIQLKQSKTKVIFSYGNRTN